MWNARAWRIFKTGKSLKTRNRFTKTSGCPTITLGDLTFGANDGWFKGEYSAALILVSGFATPLTDVQVTSGTVPNGLTVAIEDADVGEISIFGTPTVFALGTPFTVQVTDANGCTGSRIYVIDVWDKFYYTGPTNIDADFNYYVIPVSGVTDPIVLGEIVGMGINMSIADLNDIQLATMDPDSNLVVHIQDPDNLGTTLTNSFFRSLSDPHITTGTTPYTGNWRTGDDIAQTWDLLIGDTSTGDWSIVVYNGGLDTGTITSAYLILKPTLNFDDMAYTFKDVAYSETLIPSNGAGPFTYDTSNLVSLPTGMSFNSSTGLLSGTPTVFEASVGYILVTGANGNVGYYYPTVYQSFTNAVPVNYTGADSYLEYLIAVSGLPNAYGTGVELADIQFSFSSTDLSKIALQLYEPSYSGEYDIFYADLTYHINGTTMIDTVIKDGSTDITLGSSPFTGNYAAYIPFYGPLRSPSQSLVGSINGDWLLSIYNDQSQSGTITYMTLTFKAL